VKTWLNGLFSHGSRGSWVNENDPLSALNTTKMVSDTAKLALRLISGCCHVKNSTTSP